MKETLFFNKTLVSILVPFIEKAETRITTLLTHESAMPASLGSKSPTELSDAALDGACADLVQIIHHTRDFVLSTQRSLLPETSSEFIYLIVALVDEMLISILNRQLPRRFSGEVEHLVFGTRNAGEQIFIRIERLLARRSQLDISIAGAYLLVLSLGFKGQYFQRGASEELLRCHRELSTLALLPLADMSYQRHTNSVVGVGKKPRILIHQQLSILCCAIGLIWLAGLISMEILWRTETAPLRRAIVELHLHFSPTSLLDGAQ